MYIKCENENVQRLHNRAIMDAGYVVEFNENGVAQVREDVGESLVNEYDAISTNTND